MFIRSQSLVVGGLAAALLLPAATLGQSTTTKPTDRATKDRQVDSKRDAPMMTKRANNAEEIARAFRAQDRSLQDLIKTAEKESGGKAISARIEFGSGMKATGEKPQPGIDQQNLVAQILCVNEKQQVQLVTMNVQSGKMIAMRDGTHEWKSASRYYDQPDYDQSGNLHILRATKVIGSDVENYRGEEIGEINDLIVDRNTGRIRFAVLSHGGMLGVGKEYYAVPWSVVAHQQDSKFLLDVSEEQIKDAPAFTKDTWPDVDDALWVQRVERYFGADDNWDPDRWGDNDEDDYWDDADLTRTGSNARVAWSGQRASKLIGTKVQNREGKDLGDIEDLAIDNDGRVKYAVLSFGGFLGIGDKLFAVPYKALSNQMGKPIVLAVNEETLKNAPGFDKNNWPDMANPRWGSSVDDFYRQNRLERNPAGNDRERPQPHSNRP